MCPAFGLGDIAAVVDWEEDVGDAGEIGEGISKCMRVRSLKDHERHARTEKNDVG